MIILETGSLEHCWYDFMCLCTLVSISTMLICQQRRRAQNRASQRAFRDRKEKHVKELEHKLQELEDKHSSLSQSHETLQQEYSNTKKQLAKVLEENESLRDPTSRTSNPLLSPAESFDPGKEDIELFNEPFFFDSAGSGLSKT